MESPPPQSQPPAAPARLDPFRSTGDTFLRLPLHAIDPFPGNPKFPIAGNRRRGLETSLAVFGNRDQLKVWSHPTQPGRYYNLDGHQRVDVLREWAEADLGIAAVLALDPAEHPDREGRLAAIRAAATSREVDCRVLADLTRAEAKAFNAAVNRNHARYDEAAVADTAAHLGAELAERRDDLAADLAARRAALEASLGALLRPDKAPLPPPPRRPPMVAPLPAPGLPAPPGPAVPEQVGAADPVPLPEPAGPPPAILRGESDLSPAFAPASTADPDPEPDPAPADPLIPFVLMVTPASHARLDAGLLAPRVRAIRERRVVDALDRLAAALAAAGADPTAGLAEWFVELAVRLADDRRAALA